MVALHDVKFAPEKFLHRHDLKLFTADSHRNAMVEPILVHLRPLIGHGPNDIDDYTEPNTAIDPFAIVGKLRVIIGETRLMECRDHHLAVAWVNVKIDVFSIAPSSGENGQSKAAPEQEGNSGGAKCGNCRSINVPFLLGNRFDPLEINDFFARRGRPIPRQLRRDARLQFLFVPGRKTARLTDSCLSLSVYMSLQGHSDCFHARSCTAVTPSSWAQWAQQ